MKGSVLFIPFEFVNWHRGRTWPYSVHYGWEEGLRVWFKEVVTIPGVFEVPSRFPASWLHHIDALTRTHRFDQVWILYPHQQIEEDLAQYLQKRIPVRVGLFMESLTYTDEEAAEAPAALQYKPYMQQQCRWLTHVAAFDEADVQTFEDFGVASTWCPWAIPSSLLRFPAPNGVQNKKAAFYGAAYGKRQTLLEHSDLAGLIERPEKPEEKTDLPQTFAEVSSYFYPRLNSGWVPGPSDLEQYLSLQRQIRKNLFLTWIADLRRFQVHLSLPTRFKGHSNRIVETACAGLPCVTWHVPNRNRTAALFKNREHVLVYDAGKPEKLAALLGELAGDEALRRQLASALLNVVKEKHSTEYRVGQLLEWIDKQRDPQF